MITIVPDTKVDDVVCCCLIHKETPSMVIKGDSDLANLGVKVLHYCPIPGCKSFQCDRDKETLNNLFARFGILPLPYVFATQEQRTLQRIFQSIFTLTIRVNILTDKIK